jgi:hypothetical protein
MLPMVAVPDTIRTGMAAYREVFCRDAGFNHVGRYITGLILNPNKTLQGIYDAQVWQDDAQPSRRAMHAAVFEAGLDTEGLMARHREVVAPAHRGCGHEVVCLDWTYAHHDRGPHIWGVKKRWDHIEKRHCLYQTVLTAVVANRDLIDGIDVVMQPPAFDQEEVAYLKATVEASYEQMEAVRSRLLELLHHLGHRRGYKKRTEMALEIVEQLEKEGHFPQANYAFDNGLLTLDLARLIENEGQHWVSELECSRHIQWQGQGRRVDEVMSGVGLTLAHQLRMEHPESFRPLEVRCRNGERKRFWVFTKVVRLKRYGRKRLVMVHEQADLGDEPRFLLTDALHWESGRVIEMWSYRWAAEIFHEFSKQVTGLEASQVRKEEAVTRHFRLSCVAQSLVQRAPVSGVESERFAFARGHHTVGQRVRTIARDALRSLLKLAEQLFSQGHSCEHVLEVVMPA